MARPLRSSVCSTIGMMVGPLNGYLDTACLILFIQRRNRPCHPIDIETVAVQVFGSSSHGDPDLWKISDVFAVPFCLVGQNMIARDNYPTHRDLLNGCAALRYSAGTDEMIEETVPCYFVRTP